MHLQDEMARLYIVVGSILSCSLCTLMRNLTTVDNLEKLLVSLNLVFTKLSSAPADRKVMTWAVPSYSGRKVLPAQGFKLHVSASVSNAIDIAERVVPILLEENITFKCVANTSLLLDLNAGVFGLSQVGKFITVYPYKNGRFRKALADVLDDATVGQVVPDVPSDYKYGRDGAVYYRFGVIATRFNTEAGHLIDPSGTSLIDERDPRTPVPDWVVDPLKSRRHEPDLEENKLPQRYIVLDVLRQRGKGGVYRALEVLNIRKTKTKPVLRRVVIKEAKFAGEVDRQGNDAQKRLAWQHHCLALLCACEQIPKPLDCFSVGRDKYLVMEDVGGTSLNSLLMEESTGISYQRITDIVLQLSKIIQYVHSRDIIISDLSPDNVLIADDGTIFVADLEDSLGDGSPNSGLMATPGFFPEGRVETGRFRDFYALGAIAYALVHSVWYKRLKEEPSEAQAWWLRPKLPETVPRKLRKLINLCLNETTDFNYDALSRILDDLAKS